MKPLPRAHFPLLISLDWCSRVNCVSLPQFNLAEILVLAGTAGAGRMAPPTITRIPARLRCVQEHSSRGSVHAGDVHVRVTVGDPASSAQPGQVGCVSEIGQVITLHTKAPVTIPNT